MVKMTSFLNLPADVHRLIASKLPLIPDIYRLMSTCQVLHTNLSQSTFWISLYTRDLSRIITDEVAKQPKETYEGHVIALENRNIVESFGYACCHGLELYLQQNFHYVKKDFYFKDILMIKAGEHGQVRIVEWLMEQGVSNFEETMVYAGLSGQLDIVKIMLGKGATNYNRTMSAAAINGHENIIKLMLALIDSLGMRDMAELDSCLYNACQGGHLNIVKMMLDLGATKYNDAMSIASKNGHYKIVRLLLDIVDKQHK